MGMHRIRALVCGAFFGLGCSGSSVRGVAVGSDGGVSPDAATATRSADSVGVVNVLTGYSHLALGPGGEATTFQFGEGGTGALLPCAGDFDGDGTDSVGFFDYTEGTFVLQSENRDEASSTTFAFGSAKDLPLCGDFDGDGVDTIGVYTPSTGEFRLRNRNEAGAPDRIFTFGTKGAIPLAGDFDGDGVDSVGVFDPKTATFELSIDGSNEHVATFTFGNPGESAVAGDFDGDGKDTIAAFDAKTGRFALRNENAPGPADVVTTLPIVDQGVAGLPPIHAPVAGHWKDSGARAEHAGFEWEASTPRAEGLDTAALDAVAAKAGALPRLHSLLVVRHGKLVHEEYFHGFHRGMSNNVQSVSKSMLSLLFGIAHKQGRYVEKTPAQVALPRLGTSPERQGILIEHLLTMSAGLAWSEVYPLTDFGNAPDPLRYVWDQPVVAPPGTQFLYSTGLSFVTGAVLQEILGERIDRFARRELFQPLGLNLHYWYRMAGVPHGGSAMHLLPRDMARIGELVLRRGTLDGKSIVTTQWIDATTAPLLSASSDSPYDKYGAKWWVIDVDGVRIVSARGFGGQFIFIAPSLDAVVVTTSVWYTTGPESDQSYSDALSLILRDVLPTFH